MGKRRIPVKKFYEFKFDKSNPGTCLYCAGEAWKILEFHNKDDMFCCDKCFKSNRFIVKKAL